MINTSNRSHSNPTSLQLRARFSPAIATKNPSHQVFDVSAGKLYNFASDKETLSSQHAELRWYQAAASWTSRRSLLKAERRDGAATSIWRERRCAYDLHVARLTFWASALWAGKQLLGALCWPRIAVSYLLFPGKMREAAPLALARETVEAHGFTYTPQCIITRDHAILDGVRIGRANFAHQPALLICPGNAMQFEDATPWLAGMANETGRPVYAFNYRSVGQSIGVLHSTNAAVRDVEACVERTLEPSAQTNASELVVLGISIGAGCAAVAIDNLKKRKVIPATGVGCFVSLHSFRSLPAAIGGIFGALTGPVSSFLLAAMNQDSLDAQAVAAKGPLARKTLVVRAASDNVIAPQAAMQLPPASLSVDGSLATTRLFLDVGSSHCDLVAVLARPDLLSNMTPTSIKRGFSARSTRGAHAKGEGDANIQHNQRKPLTGCL